MFPKICFHVICDVLNFPENHQSAFKFCTFPQSENKDMSVFRNMDMSIFRNLGQAKTFLNAAWSPGGAGPVHGGGFVFSESNAKWASMGNEGTSAGGGAGDTQHLPPRLGRFNPACKSSQGRANSPKSRHLEFSDIVLACKTNNT